MAELGGPAPVTVPLALSGTWVAYGGAYAPPRATRFGRQVTLTGLAKLGGSGAVGTVPAGWEPAQDEIFIVTSNLAPSSAGQIVVHANGQVEATLYDPGFLSLTGITYQAAA